MFSERQFDEHYKIYEGYIQKLNKQMKSLEDSDPSVTTREFKRDFNYNYAGKLWHTLFFEQFAGSPTRPNDGLIETSFDNYKHWKDDFIKTALTCRPAGWAFLCKSTMGEYFNISTDSHTEFLYGMEPLIVLDMYEHSFFIDYGQDKLAYINDFIDSLNWDLISERDHA